MITTVICVLRSGGEYRVEHVLALYRGVERFWPSTIPPKFVCLTDAPHAVQEAAHAANYHIQVRPLRRDWVGWWAKMELFAPQHDNIESMLYFDLDTIIVGSLRPLLQVRHGATVLLRDFLQPSKAQSGVMLLPRGFREKVWSSFIGRANEVMHHYAGDGQFLHHDFHDSADRWQDVCPGRILSYKANVRQIPGQVVPTSCSVLCFHGRPRPWNTPLWDSLGTL